MTIARGTWKHVRRDVPRNRSIRVHPRPDRRLAFRCATAPSSRSRRASPPANTRRIAARIRQFRRRRNDRGPPVLVLAALLHGRRAGARLVTGVTVTLNATSNRQGTRQRRHRAANPCSGGQPKSNLPLGGSNWVDYFPSFEIIAGSFNIIVYYREPMSSAESPARGVALSCAASPGITSPARRTQPTRSEMPKDWRSRRRYAGAGTRSSATRKRSTRSGTDRRRACAATPTGSAVLLADDDLAEVLRAVRRARKTKVVPGRTQPPTGFPPMASPFVTRRTCRCASSR